MGHVRTNKGASVVVEQGAVESMGADGGARHAMYRLGTLGGGGGARRLMGVWQATATTAFGVSVGMRSAGARAGVEFVFAKRRLTVALAAATMWLASSLDRALLLGVEAVTSPWLCGWRSRSWACLPYNMRLPSQSRNGGTIASTDGGGLTARFGTVPRRARRLSHSAPSRERMISESPGSVMKRHPMR